METVFTGIALLVSVVLAIKEIIDWTKDRHSKRVNEMLEEATADESRESIAISTAEKTLKMAQTLAVDLRNDNEALRQRLRLAEAEIENLRLQIAELRKSL